MHMRKEIAHNVYLPFRTSFLFSSSLFLLLGFGVIVLSFTSSTDLSFFKTDNNTLQYFSDVCPVVCDLDTKNPNIPQRALVPFSFSRIIYAWLVSASTQLQILFVLYIFDSLYFPRTSSFSGVKDRLDLNLVLSGAVCSQTWFRVNEENI